MTYPALLTISDVSKHFGDTIALDHVHLEIAPNEFFALLGPSGCGKTTLLRSIAGFEHPDSGEILVDGTDLLRVPANRRPVNLMFQSYALFPHMNVWKNVAYGLQREGLPKAEVAQRVDEVLTTVGLTEKARARPAQLSGGQRQRVALARAIVKRPRVLLLDEPLSALDRKVRAEMQIELKRLQHEVGITFVVVTHDQEEAMSMADRIAVMHDGRVQQVADPVTLYSQPTNLFVADFIGTSSLIRGEVTPGGLRALDAVLPVETAGMTGPRSLMLRPEDVEVLPHDVRAFLTGTVIETHFVGGMSRTTVRVVGQDAPLISTAPGAPRHAPGEVVGLRWEPNSAVLLEDER